MPASKEHKIHEAIAKGATEAEKIDIAARLRGWFRPEDDSTFYPIIKNFSDGECSVIEAVESLLDPIDEPKFTNGKKSVNIMDLWYSIFHVAKRTPFRNAQSHTRLIELLKAIKSRQKPQKDADQGAYTNLRDFDMAARETLNDGPGVAAGYSQPETQAFANLNYFYALVTKEGLMDLWIYAIYMLRDALEERQTDDGPRDAHIPGTAVQKYNARVPTATVWIFALGSALYKKEKDLSPTSPNQGNPGRPGELWNNGKSEFSKERWAFWKSRLVEIGEMENLDEQTTKLAREAVEVMNSSEQT